MILHDRYELNQLLGQKAGRRTWLATDLATERSVVVKLLLFGVDFEWDALKLFEREAKTLQDLGHPSIPNYLDWFEAEFQGVKGFALVQTYIPARSLESIVQSGRTFLTAELKEIAIQILDILDYLHSRNPFVIHRDLKPSNILISDRTGNSVGQVSVVDFGSVQNLAAAKGGTITIVGTYGYMPMEQFGDRAVPASDLYSLGATMLYLATGKEPADLLDDDGEINAELLVSIEPEFKAWILHLMQVRVRDRPASAQEAKQFLEEGRSSSKPNDSAQLMQQNDRRVLHRIANPDLTIFKIWENAPHKLAVQIPNSKIHMTDLKKHGQDHVSAVDLLYAFAPFILLPTLFFHPLLVLSFVLIYLVFRLYRRFSTHRLLMITPDHIQVTTVFKDWIDINRLHQNSVPNYQVWGIEQDGRYLKLKLGDKIWKIEGKPKEIRWLANEISYFTKIPIDRDFNP